MPAPGSTGWLLDTCVIVHLVRGKATGLALRERYGLFSGQLPLYLSVVSRGECLSLARRKNWTGRSGDRLAEELEQVALIETVEPPVVDAYAAIDAESQAGGGGWTARRMGKNDLWIAAKAMYYGLTLLTTDNDFEHLGPDGCGWVDLEYMPPPAGSAPALPADAGDD